MDATVTIAVLLGVVSALGYAAGALLQQRVGDRPVPQLLRLPRWWLAIGSNGLGALLHVAALRFGSLVLVQALGVLTLVLAVPLAAAVGRRRVGRREAAGTGLAAAGLAGLLLLTGSAAASALTSHELVVLVLAAALVLTVAAGRAHGLTAAAAGGLAFGVASAITQTLTVRMTDGLPFVAPAVVAVAALNVAGVLLTQRSYRRGLAGPLAVGTVANPVAAAVIGVVLLGERVRGGTTGIALALLCAAVIAAGVQLLTARRDLHTRARSAHLVRSRPVRRHRRAVTRPAGRGRPVPVPLMPR
ncbi:DMT family transporter [Actinoplanes sp. N902-109]|uniref:DMT family transporter n=1 Tax=Actinoplanes sp. (strain N902-109) TaxID=649831 RepID=UPI000329528D|nr:DMT family transporter [Actinoplanes sp. N902-109]AGL17270.1 integral membrane protein [Actinoplanes sp. N902-109]